MLGEGGKASPHLLTDEDWQELGERHDSEGGQQTLLKCQVEARDRDARRDKTEEGLGGRQAVARQEGVGESGGDCVEGGLVLMDIKTYNVTKTLTALKVTRQCCYSWKELYKKEQARRMYNPWAICLRDV